MTAPEPQLLAIDLDGTLLDTDGSDGAETRRVIDGDVERADREAVSSRRMERPRGGAGAPAGTQSSGAPRSGPGDLDIALWFG